MHASAASAVTADHQTVVWSGAAIDDLFDNFRGASLREVNLYFRGMRLADVRRLRERLAILETCFLESQEESCPPA